MQGKLVISGDVGGTNTRLVYARANDLATDILVRKNYLNKEYTSFNDLLKAFITEYIATEPINIACFAVAGPVLSGNASLTNIDWVISEAEIRSRFNIPVVRVLNDFAAIAYAVADLQSDSKITLQAGSMAEDNEAVIIGAGTGLGCCHVVSIENEIYVKSSEVGHSHFAPTDELELALLKWMWQMQSQVSVEHLVSGRGLGFIYQFLKCYTDETEDPLIATKLHKHDPAAIITEHANSDVLCNETVRLFLKLYGNAAADIVLHFAPVSKVFIAGGIAAKISRHMQGGQFIESFNKNETMGELLRCVQVELILDELIGLKGALAAASSLAY